MNFLCYITFHYHPSDGILQPPFPFMHIDTTWKFREMIDFRDKIAEDKNIEIIACGSAYNVGLIGKKLIEENFKGLSFFTT